jgi:DNA-binding MarR family transcriptional regulator
MSTPVPDGLEEAKRQWVEHGWPDADVMVAISSILRVSRRLTAVTDAALRPLDVSYARFETLCILYYAPDGEMPLGKLSERLQVHPASVTSIVDRLEQQGMVRRTRRDGDRRIVLAELLPPGRELVERGTEIVARDLLPKVRVLPDDDLAKLYDLLAAIRRSIGDFE